ncbi:MAG: hypothetical protein ABI297_00835 [Ginsengibacter sp.]
MKKLLLVFAAVAFTTISVKAQDAKSTTLSLAANIGIPTTSGLSIAYGADLQADFAVAPTTRITGSVGYEGYKIKDVPSGFKSTFGIVPILAGAKFFFGETGKMYGHAQLGYAVSTSKGGSGAFAYAPSLGYYVSPNLDLGLKYLAYSKNSNTTGSVNFRVAYNF